MTFVSDTTLRILEIIRTEGPISLMEVAHHFPEISVAGIWRAIDNLVSEGVVRRTNPGLHHRTRFSIGTSPSFRYQLVFKGFNLVLTETDEKIYRSIEYAYRTVTNVSDVTGVSKCAAYRSLYRMEAEGLVHRSSGPAGGRKVYWRAVE